MVEIFVKKWKDRNGKGLTLIQELPKHQRSGEENFLQKDQLPLDRQRVDAFSRKLCEIPSIPRGPCFPFMSANSRQIDCLMSD